MGCSSMSVAQEQLPEVKLRSSGCRGATLDYDPPGNPLPPQIVSHHDSLQQALDAFHALDYLRDRRPTHYKIHCHVLDS